jgi:hypothetical protein
MVVPRNALRNDIPMAMMLTTIPQIIDPITQLRIVLSRSMAASQQVIGAAN